MENTLENVIVEQEPANPESEINNLEEKFEVTEPKSEPEPKPKPNIELFIAKIMELQLKIEAMSKATVARNKTASMPKANKYMLLSKTMKDWGKVPQQQRDLADILSRHLEVGKEYSEDHIFKLVVDEAPNYPQLAKSVQHPTYLFRYYRNLKKDEKHAGFVARDFLQVK